jgi:hypothetical protein
MTLEEARENALRWAMKVTHACVHDNFLAYSQISNADRAIENAVTAAVEDSFNAPSHVAVCDQWCAIVYSMGSESSAKLRLLLIHRDSLNETA